MSNSVRVTSIQHFTSLCIAVPYLAVGRLDTDDNNNHDIDDYGDGIITSFFSVVAITKVFAVSGNMIKTTFKSLSPNRLEFKYQSEVFVCGLKLK